MMTALVFPSRIASHLFEAACFHGFDIDQDRLGYHRATAARKFETIAVVKGTMALSDCNIMMAMSSEFITCN